MTDALLLGIVITTIVLNTIAFALSIWAYTAAQSQTFKNYAIILMTFLLAGWIVLLAGGSVVLARKEMAQYSAKVAVLFVTLFFYTVAFVVSCVALAYATKQTTTETLTERNAMAAVLSFTFAAWLILLVGGAVALARSGVVQQMLVPQRPQMPAQMQRPQMPMPMRSPPRAAQL